jgi:hypothetical protein
MLNPQPVRCYGDLFKLLGADDLLMAHYHALLTAMSEGEEPKCPHRPGYPCYACWYTCPAVAESWGKFSLRLAQLNGVPLQPDGSSGDLSR